MTTVCMGSIPEEIQAYILSKLDGRSAAVAKKVNHLWNELITGLESCMHFWLRCCLREIPSHTLVQLTRLIQLSGGRETTLSELAVDWKASLESKLPWMFWREVYAEYCRCNLIKTGTEKKTELHFFPFNGDISCLHVQDNVIYSGHESGIVMQWSNIEDDLNCDIIYRHKRRVTSIAGLDMVTSTSNILNGEISNKIVSSSRDAKLMLYNVDLEESSTIHHYTKQVNCVRSWGSHFVAAADGSMIQGQPIWTSTDQSNLKSEITCTLFSQSAADITAVAFWEDTVVCGDEMGNLFAWSGCLDCQRGQEQEEMLPVTNLHSCVKSLFLIGDRIVCFTADNHLHISRYQDGEHTFQSHNIHETTLRTAECVEIRGPILAIGCRAGHVLLYHIPTDSHWDWLDLAKAGRHIQLSCDHVNAMVIGDDGGGPFVALATDGHCMTVVQYRRKRKQDKIVDK